MVEQVEKIILGNILYDTVSKGGNAEIDMKVEDSGIDAFIKRAQKVVTREDAMGSTMFPQLLLTRPERQEVCNFVNRIELGAFSTGILQFLTPEIEIPQKIGGHYEGGGYLFALTREGSEEYVTLEGQINGTEIRAERKNTKKVSKSKK